MADSSPTPIHEDVQALFTLLGDVLTKNPETAADAMRVVKLIEAQSMAWALSKVPALEKKITEAIPALEKKIPEVEKVFLSKCWCI